MGTDDGIAGRKGSPEECRCAAAVAKRLVICCQLDTPVSHALSDEELLECVAAPMQRYGACRQAHAEPAFYFLFSGSSHGGHSGARAALEVAARLRNLSVRGEYRGRFRIGIACQEETSTPLASAPASLLARARKACDLARDGEIVAEQSLAQELDFELSCSAIVQGPVEAPVEGPVEAPVEGPVEEQSYVALHGMREGPSRMLQARRQARRIVGREAEQDQLRSIVDEVMAGKGQIAGLCGRAGSGKSFLLAGLADTWIQDGGQGFLSRCRSSTQKQQLYPVYACLQSLAGLHGHEGIETSQDRILELLRRLGGQAAHWQSIEEVVGTGLGEDAPWHLIEQWLAEVIEVRTRIRPLLLIFEDMHFADPGTLRFVSALARLAHRGRLLVVLSYRGARFLGNLRRSLHSEIVLTPMSTGGLVELATIQTRSRSLEPNLADYLVAHCEGRPGRLLELLSLFARHELLVSSDNELRFHEGALDVADGLVLEWSSGTPPFGLPSMDTGAPSAALSGAVQGGLQAGRYTGPLQASAQAAGNSISTARGNAPVWARRPIHRTR